MMAAGSAWAVGEIARIAVIAFGWEPHDFVLERCRRQILFARLRRWNAIPKAQCDPALL
jgi:hypothetical protein